MLLYKVSSLTKVSVTFLFLVYTHEGLLKIFVFWVEFGFARVFFIMTERFVYRFRYKSLLRRNIFILEV